MDFDEIKRECLAGEFTPEKTIQTIYYKCPNCGKSFCLNDGNDPRFCSSCGANLREPCLKAVEKFEASRTSWEAEYSFCIDKFYRAINGIVEEDVLMGLIASKLPVNPRQWLEVIRIIESILIECSPTTIAFRAAKVLIEKRRM